MGTERIDAVDSKWTLDDVVALTALEKLDGPYVAWTAWSMRPAAVASVVNAITLDGIRSAVELGAGSSTLYLGRALKRTGGTLITVEEDAVWAQRVRSAIAREGLETIVRVVHAPLSPLGCGTRRDWPADAPTTWYATDWIAQMPAVDLVVVDGPAAGDRPDLLARFPAIPLLKEHLCDQFLAFLDDIDREAETRTLERWVQLVQGIATRNLRVGLGVLTTTPDAVPTF